MSGKIFLDDIFGGVGGDKSVRRSVLVELKSSVSATLQPTEYPEHGVKTTGRLKLYSTRVVSNNPVFKLMDY
jgi:hypothetical protein